MSNAQTSPVVVLTGGLGSGKSTAAHCFVGLGITVVDADAIVHELTGPDGAALASLRLLLGEDCMSPSAGLDRAKVRQAVFAEPGLRRRLEAVLHPMVQVIARQQLERAMGPYCLYVVPLWAETRGGQPRPDWVWKVVETIFSVDNLQHVFKHNALCRISDQRNVEQTCARILQRCLAQVKSSAERLASTSGTKRCLHSCGVFYKTSLRLELVIQQILRCTFRLPSLQF